MSGGLNTIFVAVPTTSKLNDQLTLVGQLRAILKEGNFTGLTLCELKDSLRNRRHQRSIVLRHLYMEIQVHRTH
jgi:hypothetical protein